MSDCDDYREQENLDHQRIYDLEQSNQLLQDQINGYKLLVADLEKIIGVPKFHLGDEKFLKLRLERLVSQCRALQAA